MMISPHAGQHAPESGSSGKERVTVYRDPYAYCSHPTALRLRGGTLLVAFMESQRRSVPLHSPSDPRFYNVLTRSTDGGQTWCSPWVIPGYDWYGVECPNLTELRNGDLLLLQWRWRWIPWPAERGERSLGRYEHGGFPWARDNDGAYLHRSTNGGITWQAGQRIRTEPHPGAYTIRAAVELPERTLLFVVTDIPNWQRIYVLRSDDGGETWEVGATVAHAPGRQFSEPAILFLRSRLLVMMREVTTGYLYESASEDGGQTWSPPRQTAIWGCPPHLLDLRDGRILCTYGYRRPPFGVRACLSYDEGVTWDIANELVIIADQPDWDCGYPASILLEPGQVMTVFYGKDSKGVTGIDAVVYSV
ncbi:MAG: hypothetical protein KatS3mg059_1020 [Thermomicrobiales bacterium]|nr:MAG: hypothetical protein KatS3mg059_1020 [Thermomicrobiales bacterium]